MVYVGAMLAVAASLPLGALRDDYDAMKRVATLPGLIDAGVLAATLSSALASFLGAPRILQALANDRLFGWLTPLGVGYGPAGNPKTRCDADGSDCAGDASTGKPQHDRRRRLDVLSRLVYPVELRNICRGSWRIALLLPTLSLFQRARQPRGHWSLWLRHVDDRPDGERRGAGDLGRSVSLPPLVGGTRRWRDSRRAYRFHLVKDGLRELADDPEGPTDWQPHILAFTETPTRRARVLRVAEWIAGHSGMITAVQLVKGDGTASAIRKQRDAAEAELTNELERLKLDAFPLVVAAPDLRIGATTLLQSWGIGPVRSNTVLLNWMDSQNQGRRRRCRCGTHGCCRTRRVSTST